MDLYRKVFRKNGYAFHGMVRTDGVSCTQIFVRKDFAGRKYGTSIPTFEEQEDFYIEDCPLEQLNTLKSRKIVGCDLGKKFLMVLSDGKNVVKYSSIQRRIESYLQRNQRILSDEKRKNSIHKEEASSVNHNCKAVDLEKYNEYLVQKDKVVNRTLKFYQAII